MNSVRLNPLPVSIGQFLGSASNRGLTKEIWISVRTDGKPGTGTAEDPFDGSTATLLHDTIVAQSTYTTIHLAPGAFVINVYIPLTAGQKLIGAGKNLTTITWTATTTPGNGVMLFGLAGVDNIVVSDLTLDCNSAIITNQAQTYGAINLRGSHNVIRNVRCTRALGGATECFTITCLTSSAAAVDEGYNTIDSCEVDGYRGGAGGATLIFVGTDHDGVHNTKQVGSRIVNCYVHDNGTDPSGLGVSGAVDCLIENNITDGGGAGFNADSYGCSRVIVRKNQFLNSGQYGVLFRSLSGDTDDHIEISDNMVTIVDPTIVTNQALPFYLGDPNATNWLVTGNTGLYTGSGSGGVYGFQVLNASGLTAYGNKAGDNCANIFKNGGSTHTDAGDYIGGLAQPVEYISLDASGNITLTGHSPLNQDINPASSDRNVTLPVISATPFPTQDPIGRLRTIYNSGTHGSNLVVKGSGGSTLATLANGAGKRFRAVAAASNWRVIAE